MSKLNTLPKNIQDGLLNLDDNETKKQKKRIAYLIQLVKVRMDIFFGNLEKELEKKEKFNCD